MNYSFSKSILISSPNAGLVTKTPNVMPMIVVIANPRTSPAPKKMSGMSDAQTVRYDTRMMENAFFIFSLSVVYWSSFFLSVSSAMTIWSSTPVPTAMSMPAMAARSRLVPKSAAVPRMRMTSETMVTRTGKAIMARLYLM